MSNQPSVMIYGLSTCIHCKHVKEFVTKHGIECNFVCIDRLEGTDRTQTITKVKSFNPRLSFPTTIIESNEGSIAVIGYKEEELKKALNINE